MFDVRRPGSVEWRAPAGATVTPTPCDDGSPFLCGSVRVPLDRADPSGRKIRIAFQILPAADPTAARPDPIFVSEGGPGGSTTASRDFWGFYALATLNDIRDLVLIDQRGTGGSGAIVCPDVQNGWNSVDDLRRAHPSMRQVPRRRRRPLRHGRHRAGHRGGAEGPRLQPDQLRRRLVRHGERTGVRLAVPRPRPGDGPRRRPARHRFRARRRVGAGPPRCLRPKRRPCMPARAVVRGGAPGPRLAVRCPRGTVGGGPGVRAGA